MINTERILQEIEKTYMPLSNKCKQEFIACSKVSTFKRGDVVVSEGQFSKRPINCGRLSRAYYLKDGKISRIGLHLK